MGKIMKKSLAVLTVVLIMMTIGCVQGFVGVDWDFGISDWFSSKASALSSSGKCGDNVYYTFNSSTGELVISGTGKMFDNGDLFGSSSVKKVVIESGVTNIGKYAFYSCENLTSVKIGNSVTDIDSYAFYNCDSLTSITIPNNVRNINDRAFLYCDGLVKITIGNGLVNIGESAFYGCNFTSVTIPNSVKKISEGAFCNCDSLKNITLPDGLTTIDKQVFEGCDSLTGLTIPNSVTSIYESAFSYCDGLKSITIPDSVTNIGNWAFRDCHNLTSITIGNGLESISHGTFWGCGNLERVTIGNNVMNISDSAFVYCNSLKSVTIPNSVIRIGNYAFEFCPSLNSILIPNSVEYIGKNALNGCSDNLVIYGYSGSYAETYAEENNITFKDIRNLVLAKPTIKSVTQNTSAIQLNWTAVQGAAGYKVYQKIDGKWKALGNVTGTSVTLKNLKAGTKYTYAIKAGAKVDGKVIWSSEYTVINTATTAVAPSKVTAKQNTSAIQLSWTKCEGATGYRIYYKSGNSWKTALSTTAATSHTFKNLKAGTKYTFAVRPYIKTDSGVVWSSYTQFITATKPANVTAKATSTSKGTVSLTWDKVNGAELYQVYYKTGNGSFKLYKTYTDVKTLSFKNLKSGTKYTFAVRAGIKTDGGNIYGGYKTSAVTVK